MAPDDNSGDDESTGGILQWTRRNVLKASGAGAGLATVGGVATADGDHEGNGTDTTTAGDAQEEGGTVHTVRTLISGPPTNPNRPADFFYQPTGLAVEPGDVVKFVFATPDHNYVSYHPALGMRRRVPTGVDAISTPISGWTADSIADDQVDPPSEMGGEDGSGENGGDEDGTNGSDGEGSDGDGADGQATEEQEGPTPETRLLGFDTPGVYDLFCSPHEGFGMAMRVVVGEETEAPFETSNPDALPEPRVGPVGLARVTLTDPALQPSNVVEQGRVPWESLQANQTGGDDGDSGNGS